MDAQKAFLAAVLYERQQSWIKAATKYEEVFKLIYRKKWRSDINKEKLRLLLFECHFHCAVALQNIQNHQDALRHFTKAMKVVSWTKDECRAGCIAGRVLHHHVPTLARMACCYAHQGELNKARESADQAILLDFTNPDLFCVRALVNHLLCQQKRALSDASFAIQLNSNHVCGWLLRGLFRKLKKDESNILKTAKQEPDLVKAFEINPYAMTFVNIKNIGDHFQTMFDRFLPSFRVAHTLSIRDVIDSKTVSSGVRLPYEVSSKTFVCGVARPQRIIRTCPAKENAKEMVKFLEGIHSERSISHHKQSLACKDFGLIDRGTTSRSLLDNPSKSLVPRLTLRDVVDAKSACICRHEKIIGRRGLRHRENMLEDNDDISSLTERMYSRKWLQDRIPAKIPDIAGCRQFPQ